ncbi:MAG: hypothetical protein IT261_10805 [Saprospiraceae bacterium]|nr:hypothetical protein [Saprospiraceae bacterium]
MILRETPAFLVRIAKPRNVLMLLVLFVVFAGGIMPSMEDDIKALSGGIGVIDLEYFYTPQQVKAMLDTYGSEGRHLYLIAQWTVDLIFPVIAGMFFATALVMLGGRKWWWMGLWVTLTDWTENVWITWMLLDEKGFSEQIARISCSFTVMKWGGIFVGNLMLLWLLIQRARRKWGKLAEV